MKCYVIYSKASMLVHKIWKKSLPLTIIQINNKTTFSVNQHILFEFIQDPVKFNLKKTPWKDNDNERT